MSTTRRVNVVITGNAGSIQATLNQLQHGITRTGDKLAHNSRQLGLWGQQMRALGTTARYALAGGVVFGVTSAIAALSQFERKMGDIGALMTTGPGSGINQMGAVINRQADYIITASTRLAQPVGELQQTMQTFYSSFQPRQGQSIGAFNKDARDFTETVTKLGRVSEVTDLQKLTEGVTGFAYTFGRGPQDVPKFANEIAQTTRTSVGFRGDVLAQNLGRLGASFHLGGFSPEQGLGMLVAASLGGGSPAVIARGISQLSSNILAPSPTNKRQLAAYQAAGLPTDPNALARLGGNVVIQRMMEAVQRRGGLRLSGAGIGISAEQLDALGPDATPGQVGVSGGGTKLAHDLFGRVESLRQFAQLLTQGTGAMDKYTKQIEEAGRKQKVLNDMFRIAMSQSQLSRAGNAWQNTWLSVVRGFDPALHPAADAVTRGSEFLQGHPRLTTGVASGGLTIGASRILARMSGRYAGALGRVGRVRGLGMVSRLMGAAGAAQMAAASGALTAEAMPSLISGGGGQLMGTRADPMWVMIHPASWYVGSPGGMGAPVAGADLPGKGGGRLGNMFKRLAGPLTGAGAGLAARLGLMGGGVVAGAALLPAAWAELGDAVMGMDEGRGRARRVPSGARFHLLRQFARSSNPMALGMGRQPSRAQQRILDAFLHHYISAQTAEKRLERLQHPGRASHLESVSRRPTRQGSPGGNALEIAGEAMATITLDLTDAAKKVVKLNDPTVHVPVKIWGTPTAPQARAKPKAQRRGGH